MGRAAIPVRAWAYDIKDQVDRKYHIGKTTCMHVYMNKAPQFQQGCCVYGVSTIWNMYNLNNIYIVPWGVHALAQFDTGEPPVWNKRTHKHTLGEILTFTVWCSVTLSNFLKMASVIALLYTIITIIMKHSYKFPLAVWLATANELEMFNASCQEFDNSSYDGCFFADIFQISECFCLWFLCLMHVDASYDKWAAIERGGKAQATINRSEAEYSLSIF